MCARPLAAFAACLAMLPISSALAGDIYRYVDDDGGVHYVDRPSGAPDEERLTIASEPTDPAVVRARVAERRQARSDEADAEAASDEQAEKCRDYRERLERYVTSQRLYRENEAGERVYLDEAEREEARARVEELIANDCT